MKRQKECPRCGYPLEDDDYCGNCSYFKGDNLDEEYDEIEQKSSVSFSGVLHMYE
jgi:hypothetical protein